MAEAGAPGTIDPATFRGAMARWSTGVSVVTTRSGDHDAGLTVNAFLSVALSPPTVLVSIAHDAEATPHLDRSGRFAIGVLRADQQELSVRFARAVASTEKFAGLPVHRGLGGVPLIDGTLATLECRVVSHLDVVDHRLYVGEVERIALGPDAPPLLFLRSQYASVEPDGRLRLPVARP